MRIGYLGPEGTFAQEAVISASSGRELELIALPTIFDTVMAVRDELVERALVPIENSLEGSVNATLDALAIETEAVAIVGEVVLPISQCLIARGVLALERIEVVVSHPQANAQCARFIRTCLPGARVLAASSTADAVRTISEHEEPWAAIGNRLAAQRYGCEVLRAGIEDEADNETRFVWLGRVGDLAAAADAAAGAREPGGSGPRASRPRPTGSPVGDPAAARWKTAVVFWGAGSEAPGWLVACLSELATRGVNLTRIESRPRRQGLGRYMFFADVEGRDSEPHVAEALRALRGHVEVLRVLGSFPAA